ncbi:MAG: hypothetical protein HY908_31785 [Myxococcales bacterium]|nr:hypothetical protein [Myxococcales bacterium]
MWNQRKLMLFSEPNPVAVTYAQDWSEGGAPTGEAHDVDEVLIEAPVGSRVFWDKPSDPNRDAAQNNALKIGPDEYWIHPYRHPYSRSAFERELSASEPPGPVYVKIVQFVAHPELK